MAKQWETVDYEVVGKIARVTLNRPRTHNTLNARLILDLDEAVHEADRDPNVRVILLRGAGPSFSAGHDLSRSPGDPLQQQFREQHSRSVEDRFDVEEDYFLEKCLNIRNLKKPTIAAIHGHVVLGGMMVASMCDLIIAAEDTNLWNPSLRHTGTGGEVMMLPWEIGVRKAKEYLWTGDPIPVEVAHRLGMVNRVVPSDKLDEEAMYLAERIALMPARAVSLTKRSLNKAQEFMGTLAALEYHFILHQLGHATLEATEWNAEAASRAAEQGFKGWLAYRDGPFDEQARLHASRDVP